MIKKILAGSLLGASLIAGYRYVRKLKKMQAELEIVPAASIYQISWDGVIIRVDVLMKNPTKGSFSVRFPFVKLSYKDASVGSSQVINKEIKVLPFGETRIEKILVQIPVMNIFSVSSAMLKAVQQKEPVILNVKVITEINLGWTRIPYENTQELTLKK